MQLFDRYFPIIKEDYYTLKDWVTGDYNAQDESQCRRIEQARFRALALIAIVFGVAWGVKTLAFVITFPLEVLSKLLLSIVAFIVGHDLFKMTQKVYEPELKVESFTRLLIRQETIEPEVAEKLTEETYLQSLWMKLLKKPEPPPPLPEQEPLVEA